jgi:AcrR family transcriptional regulator
MAETELKDGSVAAHGGRLTQARIVAAAMTILDRDGYDALTMRRVAEELDIKAASLYWHVRDKEQLEDLLFAALLDQVELEIGGADWRDDLRAVARQMKHQLLARRDMQRVSAGRFVLAPALLRHIETIMGVLRRGGFGKRDAAYAIYALLNYVNGFVLFQTAPLSAAQAKGVPRRAIFARLRRQFAALSPDTYPHAVAVADELTSDDPEARFEFGLDVLIAGLEARLAQIRTPS